MNATLELSPVFIKDQISSANVKAQPYAGSCRLREDRPVPTWFNAKMCWTHPLNKGVQYFQVPRRIVPPQAVKIPSQDRNTISTPSSPHPAHLSVELDLSSAIESICPSSFTIANIPAQDFPVFTTDSQSTWLPNSASSSPATSAPQLQNPVANRQDFVLFDSPQPRQANPNHPYYLSSKRRHSNHNRKDPKLITAAAQNQRVAQLLQEIGLHSTSSASVSATRFANSFYAPSASPSASPSSVSFSPKERASHIRPPVPLFNQSTAGIHQHQAAKMMNAAGLSHLPWPTPKPFHNHSHNLSDVDLDDFTVFEGGASAFPSPSISSVMDYSGSISSSTSTLGTVSPHDLLVHESLISTPNSAALTALTSPSIYNESPDIDEFDVSPDFGTADLDASGWSTLFPEVSNCIGAELTKPDHPSVETSDEVDYAVEQVLAVSNRKKVTNSPVNGGRHSSVAGVNPRKRDKPLPPIVVEDPNDEIAMRRARNTLAARKSRERKALRFEELEARIAELEAERDHWKNLALSRAPAS
ncbi:hypothetical protein E4U41_004206 [Claviceps citrina]|nr:hypothetical protein E4U41_004206 [Claviceps citrina]